MTLTLEQAGFIKRKKLKNQGYIAISRFIFTCGLCCHTSLETNDLAYQYRYCYEHYQDCLHDFEHWNGEGDPEGNWIKRKGLDGDFSNPNYQRQA